MFWLEFGLLVLAVLWLEPADDDDVEIVDDIYLLDKKRKKESNAVCLFVCGEIC